MPEPEPKVVGAQISQRRCGTKEVWLSAKARDLARGFSNPGQALWPVTGPPLADAVEVLHPRALVGFVCVCVRVTGTPCHQAQMVGST